MNIDTALSYIALISVSTGCVFWLVRTTYRASVYLAQIRDTLQDLTAGIHSLQGNDESLERRVKDLEHFLAKTTEFTIRTF